MSRNYCAFKIPEGYRISDVSSDLLIGWENLPPIAPYDEIEKILLREPGFFKSPYWVPEPEGERREGIIYIEGLDLNGINPGSDSSSDTSWAYEMAWAISEGLAQGLISAFIEFIFVRDPVILITMQGRPRREDFRKVLDPLEQYGPFVVVDFQTGTFHAASDL